MQERKTVQKELIYAALAALGNHPTADQVYEYVHSAHPSVSRATVYRVLRQMAENGQAEKVGMLNGADRFDHNVYPHCHARCDICGKVFDVPLVKPPLEHVLPTYDEEYEIRDYSILFSGLCSECKKKKAESETGAD